MSETHFKEIQSLERKIDEHIRKSEVSGARISKDIEYMTKELKNLEDLIAGHYVTKDEFEPIKKVVYGLISVILLAVIGAIMALVIK